MAEYDDNKDGGIMSNPMMSDTDKDMLRDKSEKDLSSNIIWSNEFCAIIIFCYKYGKILNFYISCFFIFYIKFFVMFF